MYVMAKVMQDIIDKAKEQDPIHQAVNHAFLKHFEKGFTLRDLPFLNFVGMPNWKAPKVEDIPALVTHAESHGLELCAANSEG